MTRLDLGHLWLDNVADARHKLRAAWVINRRIVNSSIGRDVKQQLSSHGPQLLESTVAQRVIYSEAAARGLAVHEADPGGIADSEIRDLTTELEAISNG